jgi:hypothetical protein
MDPAGGDAILFPRAGQAVDAVWRSIAEARPIHEHHGDDHAVPCPLRLNIDVRHRSFAPIASDAVTLYVAAVRVAIVEGADAPWRGEAVVDQIGLVIDGCEFWCGGDFDSVVLVEADDAELAFLATSEISLPWLV